MSRLVKKSPSVCTDLPLNNTDICAKLRLLKQLLGSCFGPTGRLKHVHNNIGGHVVTTSTSAVLLAAISSSQPLVNLIKTSILNHVSRFSDCGLFAAVFCLDLIEQTKRTALRESVAIRVNKHLLGLCTTYLQQEDCGCKVRLDFCSSRNLLQLARSIISSKPACVLTEPETLHISKLAVQAFLLSIPCGNSGIVTLGKTVMVSLEGYSVLHSAVFPGLLVNITDDVCLSEPDNLHSTPLSVVLFSASLAGDLSELGDGTIELHPGADMDSQILDELLKLGKQAVDDKVKLFMCQKIIHPVLQHFLRSQGVIVLERLGIALMEPLLQLTGAQPVATLHCAIPAKAYGTVNDLSIRRFGSKKLLHLLPSGETAICTMVLCHRNETMLSELKLVCQKTEDVLRLSLKEPFALLGGGCTETHLAAYIRHKAMKEATDAASVLGCSQAEYLLGIEGFCRSLESVATTLEHSGGYSLIDLTHAHHWSHAADVMKEHTENILDLCGCGLLKGAQPVATLHCAIPAKAYGTVNDLSIRQFGSKKLLHLLPSGETAICTMVLCHRNETMLSELKKTENVLRLSLKEPFALLGGGCTETHLAAYIRHKAMKEATDAASVLGCSQAEYLLCIEGFCCSLIQVDRLLHQRVHLV